MTRQKEKPSWRGGHPKCKKTNSVHSTKPTIKNQKLLRIRALNLIEAANELSEIQDALYGIYKAGKGVSQ